jgi:hypothetical protein
LGAQCVDAICSVGLEFASVNVCEGRGMNDNVWLERDNELAERGMLGDVVLWQINGKQLMARKAFLQRLPKLTSAARNHDSHGCPPVILARSVAIGENDEELL